MRLAAMMDYSILPKETREAELRQGCAEAIRYGFAAFYTSSAYWSPLVKEALAQNRTIKEVALEKAASGALKHRAEDRPVRPEEIEAALGDLCRLTEGGIVGGGGD